MNLEYAQVFSWLKDQPPAVLGQLVSELTVAWDIKTAGVPDTYEIVLTGFTSGSKIDAIKEFRSLFDTSLLTAKQSVDALESYKYVSTKLQGSRKELDAKLQNLRCYFTKYEIRRAVCNK